MKFIVSASRLYKQLSTINGVITTNPVIPILENFLFEINKDKLTITASDLQIVMVTEMSIESKENGEIAVPAKILLETLKNFPEQPITFTIDESTYGIEISSNNGRYKIAGEKAKDFPKIPKVLDGFSVKIASDVLNKAIKNTILATSNDELRPAMTGVFFKFEKSGSTFVATDAHRLLKYHRKDIKAKNEHIMIVPHKALKLLRNNLPLEPTDVNINCNESNVFFDFGQLKMICRLIDERFPDYENVIPLDNQNNLTIGRREILDSLRRVAIYANKTTHQLRIKITGNQLLVSAEDLEFSNEANEKISCEHDGADLEIGFNAKGLLELLDNLEADQITFLMDAPNKATIIAPTNKADEKEDIMLLVMPVALDHVTS